MKTRFFYYLGGLLFFFGILNFAFGLCNTKVDAMAVLLEFWVLIAIGMAYLVAGMGNVKSRLMLYCILCVLGFIFLIGMGTFEKQLFAWVVPQNIHRWWCIGLISASVLLTIIPSLVKKNVVGAVFILLAESVVLFFIASCWRTLGQSHPFITGDFFWCSGGLFGLALTWLAFLFVIEGWKTRHKTVIPKSSGDVAEIDFPSQKQTNDGTADVEQKKPLRVIFEQGCQIIKEEILGVGWRGIFVGLLILLGAVKLVLGHLGIW